MLELLLCVDLTLIAAHGGTIADRAPARGPIAADLTVGPTVESAGAGVTVARRCPTAAGTSAIA